MKKFIITIDTEGDNLWEWKEGKDITTKNVYTLQRFQDLCDKYNFKPVWLSNWEMLQNDDFVTFIKKGLKRGTCELGMHLHAWNNPPFYELPCNNKSGQPYLIEYPVDIMEQKIEHITNAFIEKFGFVPKSHRAGRWAINDDYYRLLHKYGYKIDCSVTPGISWKTSCGMTPGFTGMDYSGFQKEPYIINGILEVPVTTLFTHKIFPLKNENRNRKIRRFYHSLKGRIIWLRPNGKNLKEMLWLVDKITVSDVNYIMFMIHSSELMQGGSPTFKNIEDIEHLYSDLEVLFHYISFGYKGITLKEYASDSWN